MASIALAGPMPGRETLTQGQSPDALRRYLEHIPQGDFLRGVSEPVEPPPSAPARAPQQTELPLADPVDAESNIADPRDAMDAMPNWDAHFAD